MVEASDDEGRERSSAELRLQRDRHRTRLTKHLEQTEDEALIHLVWNIHALQSGRGSRVRPEMDFPAEAATATVSHNACLPPWDLELVVNERLVARPFPTFAARGLRLDPCLTFHPIAYAVFLARQVADLEVGLVLKRMDVMRELARIGHRQFEWQRGFVNGPQVYRWHYLYAGPLARAHFEARHGLAVPDFAKLAFVLHGLFLAGPAGPADDLPRQAELPAQTVAAGLKLLAKPLEAARSGAREIRKSRTDINYQASQLRTTPIIGFAGGTRLRAPLPDLVLVRATEGIYYDLVGARGDVRNEVAARFEAYTRDLLNAALPDRRATPEITYRWRGETVAGPDIMLHDGARLAAVIECKARKMSLRARYAETAPGGEDGIDELAKGVFQLWKYVSHVRRGLVSGAGLDGATACVLLTLDNWMTLSFSLREEVLSRAQALTAAKDSEITEEDRRPVVFASIEDLELTLQNVDGPLLDTLLRRATDDDCYPGHTLNRLLSDDEKQPDKPYPLGGRIEEVLPWFAGARRSPRPREES